MSKNIKLNNTEYNGVSTVQLPTAEGGNATFKDVDEITIPSGTKTITSNGTHDVTNYASAVVNVASGEGGGVSDFTEKNVVTFVGTTESLGSNNTAFGIKIKHGLSKKPKFAIITSDAPTDGTTKGKIIGVLLSEDIKGYHAGDSREYVLGSIIGTNASTGTQTGISIRFTSDFTNAQTSSWYWDEEYIYITNQTNNVKFSESINYTLTCYA